MRKFSDLNIKPRNQGFIGDKIKMMRILNQEIIVYGFKIKESKFENGRECLHLQIEYKDEKYVLFTGSKVLMDMIQQVPENEFPFSARIEKVGDAYQFN